MGVNFWGTTAQLNLPGKVGVSCILEDLLIYTKDFLFWKEQDTLQYHLLTPNLILWPLKDNIWHLMRNSYLWLFSQKMVTKEFSPRQLLNLWPEKKGEGGSYDWKSSILWAFSPNIQNVSVSFLCHLKRWVKGVLIQTINKTFSTGYWSITLWNTKVHFACILVREDHIQTCAYSSKKEMHYG